MLTRNIAIGAAAVVAVAGIATVVKSDPKYHVNVRLASGSNLVKGGTVQVNGWKAGTISKLKVQNGQALVELSMEKKFAPLHDGATAVVDWKALLGERIINITDGEKTAARIPDGGMLSGTGAAPVELDQVLNALDEKTRTHLASAVQGLNTTLSGKSNTKNIAATLQTAGPAVQALGDVLRGLGTDGPAIKALVTRLNEMVGTLAARDTDIRAMVDQLAHLTQLTAAQRDNLSSALQALPGTLDSANTTLGTLPGAVDKANTLLKNLRPSTKQLPAVSANLKPVLETLTPVSARLRSTLASASQVLQYTPGLLTTANATLPGFEQTLGWLQPVLSFVRPYTPEAVGFFAAWASTMANYDANGNYARIFAQAGAGLVNVNPGIELPGLVNDPYPLPGANVHQAWTDAFGSGAR